MSRAALYKGLGVGLMSFGDGLQKQMAISAEQRRQESLLAMKRQWQMEDRDWQVDRDDALFTRDQAAQRSLLEFGHELKQPTEEERRLAERQAEAELTHRQAQTGLTTVQTRVAERSLEQEGGDPTSTMQNVQARTQNLMELDPSMSPAEAENQAWIDLSTNRSMARDGLWEVAVKSATDIMRRPDDSGLILRQMGIDPMDPQALLKLTNAIYDVSASRPGAGAEGGEATGTMNDPIPVDEATTPIPGKHYLLPDGSVKMFTGGQ